MITLKKTNKNCSKCFAFQQTQPKDKIVVHRIAVKPEETIGINIFTLNNMNYLCIIDYHIKLLIGK